MSEQEITLDDFNEHEEGSANNEIAPPTELAKIPIDWSSTRLDDVALDTEGAFVDGPFGSNLKANEMIEDGYARVVQLQNIRPSKFIDSNYKYINEEKFEELKRHGAEPGDLAIAKMAEPVARACLLPEIEDQYLVVADCIKLSVDESEHNSIFVLFALNSRPVWKQAFSRSRGSTRKRINLTQLKQVQIPSPPLPEQRKIATVLYTVDRAIEKTDELVSQTERVKTGLAQDLLNHGINNQQMAQSNSRFGLLPDSWKLQPLKQVGEIAGRTAPEKDDTECWGGDIPWATPSEITSLIGQTIDDTEEHITKLALEKVSSNLLPPMSVLMTTRATIGKCAVNTVEMTTNQGFKNLIPGEELDTWYAYYRLDYERDYLASLSKGSTFPEVGKDTVENFLIPIPPISEQREIGELLRSVDKQILCYKNDKSHYERLKRGLMQDLLSGTVRTTDTNIEVPDEIAQYG